ncbi:MULTISPECIES: replication initiation protein [Pseudoalteromonas]|jgi:plasmid replication initiation protein|uniref:replication initiation protein n=1 Tax=Pseudoalteromonas TaxID=53246 RepID=UPI00235988D2|nr:MULTISPECIES: replication initiation protein [Pseudoalteromonas]MCP4053024.1 replication initiation protein [Mesoflavibacter sp.]MDC9566360.1 replication initiation protein [Pseudoalteromonas sp. GAB2316C]MDC9570633.1 replication initiation protein [Pseudoalteromonas sp. GABNB9D]MDC9574790.1 replication initiation protein [Pseudoalteromonas sp. GABNS16A]MDC9579142.1 replication initiation protein [Pseudoalteromonas sp. GABNS16E]
MSSKNSPKIVFANKLLHAGYSLEVNEQRLINLALSKINSKKSNPGKIVIYPTEYAKCFGLSKHSVYEQLSAAAESLRDKSVSILDDSGQSLSIPWVSSAKYEKLKNQGSFINIEFSKEIEPYIFNIEGNFTELFFHNTVKLNTLASFRLYGLLNEVRNYKNYKRRGSVVMNLQLPEMKKKLFLSESYEAWRDFKNRVLLPAIEKINAHTDLCVTFQPKKMGNCITAIEFSYIPQSDGQHIARPRLARRPKVKKGSHEEGVWARVNLNRLGGYELSNQNENPTFRLAKADIRRCVEYAKILGDDKAKSYYSHQLRN